MKKDPDLESALSRNRRWIVNNQIKNIILRYPNQVIPIKFLQKKFKTLDLQGRALNWLKKYPCCFEIFRENDEHFCLLTKRMMHLVEEEESVRDLQEPVLVERLAKVLMLSSNQRLNVTKLNELKRNFGFPDDYLIRIVAKYPEKFRVVNYGGRRNSMEIELVCWSEDLAVSAIEKLAREEDKEPCFSCSLPSSWVKSWERFNEFNSTPYISPYLCSSGLTEGSKEKEKRTVGLVHELLSLTLWKKMSILKLGHFKREFELPEKLNVVLLKHPGIFYVSNKYQIYTVLLRAGYRGSELINKDPLVVVKDKFGELMQEGLHEYNQRHRLLNLEKKKKKGVLMGKPEKRQHRDAEMSEQEDQESQIGVALGAQWVRRISNSLALSSCMKWCSMCKQQSEFVQPASLFMFSCPEVMVYRVLHLWIFVGGREELFVVGADGRMTHREKGSLEQGGKWQQYEAATWLVDGNEAQNQIKESAACEETCLHSSERSEHPTQSAHEDPSVTHVARATLSSALGQKDSPSHFPLERSSPIIYDISPLFSASLLPVLRSISPSAEHSFLSPRFSKFTELDEPDSHVFARLVLILISALFESLI
ncbi:hypothetical protein Ancab_038538 [Ancistrocladus abbreviatus]